MCSKLSLGIALPAKDVVLTIGTFDGVHRGHQYLIHQVLQRAQETSRLGAVLTFNPHPRAVLRPELPTAYLCTSQERIQRLRELGFDLVVVADFDANLAQMPASEFVCSLYDQLRMRELWVGQDFTLGRGREGGSAQLQALGSQMGYQMHIVAPLLQDGQPINSTRIRQLLSAGAVDVAARLLGRYYAFIGQVIPGRHVGRTLGIRTANIACDPERVIPANGVYAAWAEIEGTRHKAVVNIGIRPSFGPSERLLESHILDYEAELYGHEIKIEFVQYLRPELHFDQISELVGQVQRDIEQARTILNSGPPSEARMDNG
ncbi:MAG: bifunctional riboflavin kinase/FAD synthetase [Anaerolineae bacterium]